MFGLTGGAGSGKSTVAGYFRELGARVIDADALGHALLRRPGAVFDEVVRRFGDGILAADGEIDRCALGAVVFAEPARRLELNAILHPRIIKAQRERAAALHAEDPRAVILVEAALIYEAGVETHFRKIIVAWATDEQQIERLTAKAGLTMQEAEARLAAQMPAADKRRRADFVIDCSGTLEDVRTQVAELYPNLKRLVEP